MRNRKWLESKPAGLSTRRLWVQAMALVFALGGVGMTQAAETPPQVAVCQGCHQGARGFEGTPLDELTESIAQLAASGKPHPPLPVKADVEAEAEALARALLKASGQGATEK